MLPKSNRFTFKSKLPRQLLNSQSFSLKHDKNDIGLKVAIVVSKKVDKRAVVRNKIKRIISEAVRINFPAETKLTLIFYTKSSAVENPQLTDEVRLAVEQII